MLDFYFFVRLYHNFQFLNLYRITSINNSIAGMLIIKKIIFPHYLLPSFRPLCYFSDNGTEYNQWAIVRAADQNHNISHLKRKEVKDRYSIHKLTNLQFLKDLVKFHYKYNLKLNENIILLTQINHIIQVKGKKRENYQHITTNLIRRILSDMEDPPDLICIGTFLGALVTMRMFSYEIWFKVCENILAYKFDEDFDELFGIIYGLKSYREEILLSNHFQIISKDEVLGTIPIIYRNSLNTLRQFIVHNIYNIKECKIIFEALYDSNINESFFWDSMKDWFNIYTKQQLNKKQMEEYFIMNENAIDKVLHDNGIIRPRPILQQITTIMYILSEFGLKSWRYIEFAQDLILYAMENGSKLYDAYEQIQRKENQEERQIKIKLNSHIKFSNEEEKNNVSQMERKYKTIFINPISLKNKQIVQILAVFSRAYNKFKEKTKKESQSAGEQEKKQKSEFIYLDPRVKKWLLLQLVKPEMSYTLKQILVIQKCDQFLKQSHFDLSGFIFDKLKNLRSSEATIGQILQIMRIIQPIDYFLLGPILADFLQRTHPSQILKFTRKLELQKLFPYFAEYLLRLPQAVNIHENYYSFQQNCYFLLLLLQNKETCQAVSFEEETRLKMNYDSEMQQLKQSIKIATYSRGFKMTSNSNFHKLLDYVDVVEFFQGGRS